MTEPLLVVRGLTTAFESGGREVRAIDDISFEIGRGQTLGIVGESGSGKSVTSLSILRLLPTEGARIEKGQVLFHGRDLVTIPERELRKVRGAKIAMIFQEPMTSLNPVYRVGSQIVEAIRLHRPLSRSAARARAIELLTLVGIPDPKTRIDAYPHELSGGMRQRVMIAMALSCEPEVLIADEPTTALDVTIQAQILELLKRLRESLGMSVILITHDLGVVAEFVDHVIVMYAGRVVESAPVAELFRAPLHPYTRGLLRSIPPIGMPRLEGDGKRRLPTIEGVVPGLHALPKGCRFEARCELRQARCREEEPELREISGGESAGARRLSRCHFAEGMAS